MNVLVVGGAGYIGSVLVGKLLAKGHAVRVLDRLYFGGESLLHFLGQSQFEFVYGDIRQQDRVKKALKDVDSVVHLAAIVGEHACDENQKEAEEINYNAAVTLAHEAKKAKIKRFIFTSTCSNYGISSGNSLATESSPVHPLSHYAKSKVKAEKDIVDLTSASFGPTILRLATVFGLSPRMRFDLLVSEFVRDAFISQRLTVYKPEAFRPLVHVSDVVEAILAVLQSPGQKMQGQTYNVGFKNYKKKEIVSLVKQAIPRIVVDIKKDFGDLRDYQVSFKKIHENLGFVAKTPVETGIKETVQAINWGVFRNIQSSRYTNVGWSKV